MKIHKIHFVSHDVFSNHEVVSVYQTFLRTGHAAPTDESIMTWIRNKIHHADELARPNFSQVELKSSVDQMIVLLS